MNAVSTSMILAALAASLSASEKMISTATAEFPNALPGKRIDIQKVSDDSTGKIRIKSSSPDISSADDLVRLEREEARLLKAKYGALGGDLQKKIQSMKDADRVTVEIGLKYPEDVKYYDKTKGYTEAQLRAQSLAVARMNPLTSVRDLQMRYGLADAVKSGPGQIICALNKHKLQGLMFDKDIASITEYEEPVPAQTGGTPNLSTLASSAYSHSISIPSSGMGNGINAATFESGLTQSFVTCSGLNIAAWDPMTVPATYPGGGIMPPGDSAHSLLTFRCLANMAKQSNLYHRRSWTYGEVGDSTWIIDNAIRTTSLSITNNADQRFSSALRIMDDFAYRWPFPVFNVPTANDGFPNVSHWRCYNAISVGNARHANQNHWELRDTLTPNIQWAGCTRTRNPAPIYPGCVNGTGSFPNCVGDREMPILVAPGISPKSTAVGVADRFQDPCIDSVYQGCGTSFATPTTNGLAAVIMSKRSDLLSWPERVRAALLVTANNVDRGEWHSSTSDGRDGAGVIFGARAVNFAQNFTLVTPTGTPSSMAMSSGSIYASDFGTGDIVYYIRVPSPQPAGRHLRVVLTWDSNPLINDPVNELSDLDLVVIRNQGTTGSYSFNGNVEIVDIPANQLTSNGVYAASIKKVSNRIPAGGRADFFYYAIAWTWIDNHAL